MIERDSGIRPRNAGARRSRRRTTTARALDAAGSSEALAHGRQRAARKRNLMGRASSSPASSRVRGPSPPPTHGRILWYRRVPQTMFYGRRPVSEISMSQDTLNLLAQVFRAVFRLAEDSDLLGLSQAATEAWDSLGHVTLVTALESELEVEISPADSMEMTSYEMVVEILDELLAEKSKAG
jgi:acyl carrier protein